MRPDDEAVRPTRGGHPSYPLIIREYKLNRFKPDGNKPAGGDLWLLEFSCEEVASYPSGADFDPSQRVAFAAELKDLGEKPVNP
jgi:hypothetical protein